MTTVAASSIPVSRVTASPSDERLFGTSGAEELYFTLAEAYEAQIDPYCDVEREIPYTIEEWTTKSTRDAFPSVDLLVEWVCETTGDDLTEGAYDAIERAVGDDLKAEFDKIFDTWASRITYRMADKLVATHVITWFENDLTLPLADGKPIYTQHEDQ